MNNNKWIVAGIIGLNILFVACIANDDHQNGKKLYEMHCANCHGKNGEGLGKQLIPPLRDSDYLKQHSEDLVCIINNGLSDSIYVNGVLYDQPMAAIKGLSIVQMTNLVNYINNEWPFRDENFNLLEIETSFEQCE